MEPHLTRVHPHELSQREERQTNWVHAKRPLANDPDILGHFPLSFLNLCLLSVKTLDLSRCFYFLLLRVHHLRCYSLFSRRQRIRLLSTSSWFISTTSRLLRPKRIIILVRTNLQSIALLSVTQRFKDYLLSSPAYEEHEERDELVCKCLDAAGDWEVFIYAADRMHEVSLLDDMCDKHDGLVLFCFLVFLSILRANEDP